METHTIGPRLSLIALALRRSGFWTRLARALAEGEPKPNPRLASGLRRKALLRLDYDEAEFYNSAGFVRIKARAEGWVVWNSAPNSLILFDQLDYAALNFVATAWALEESARSPWRLT